MIISLCCPFSQILSVENIAWTVGYFHSFSIILGAQIMAQREKKSVRKVENMLPEYALLPGC